MSRSFEPESDIANSSNPKLRLLTVPKLKSGGPDERHGRVLGGLWA